MLLRTARATHKFLAVVQLKKKSSELLRFWNFTMLQKNQKSIAQADREIKHHNSFENMVVKIDMNVFRIQRLILRTKEAETWQKN